MDPLHYSHELDGMGTPRVVATGRSGEASVKLSARIVLVLPRINTDNLGIEPFTPRATFADGLVTLTPDVPELHVGLAEMFITALNAGSRLDAARDGYTSWDRAIWQASIIPGNGTGGAESTLPMQALENVLVSLLADLDVLAKGGGDSARLAIAQKPLFNGKIWGEDWAGRGLGLNMAKLGGRRAFDNGSASLNQLPIIPPNRG